MASRASPANSSTARAGTAVRHRQIPDPCPTAASGISTPSTPMQRCATAGRSPRCGARAPAPSPRIRRPPPRASRQDQIGRHHQVDMPKKRHGDSDRIEQGTQRRQDQHHQMQQHLPGRKAPGGLLGRSRNSTPHGTTVRASTSRNPVVCGACTIKCHWSRQMNQITVPPTRIPAAAPRHPPRASSRSPQIEQQPGHQAQSRAHQHRPAEFRALQHRPHHQQRRQRRKHPERREFGNAHAIEQAQQVEESAGLARPLVFRKQKRAPAAAGSKWKVPGSDRVERSRTECTAPGTAPPSGPDSQRACSSRPVPAGSCASCSA
jgi:hypothetical protein